MKKKPEPPTPHRSLTTTQAAAIVGLSPSTVLRAIKDGKLKAWATPGGHWRVALADVHSLGDSDARP